MNIQQLREKGGVGFVLENGRLALTSCPECHKENYAFNVLSGLCTWCGFDVNKEEK